MMRSILVPFVVLIASACSEATPQPQSPEAGTSNPCALVLCGGNTVCVVQPDGSPRCVNPPAPDAGRPCMKTGCSGTVCSDEPVITTCEFRPIYACYQTAICERNSQSGACGFRQTPELVECLQSYQ